MIQMNVPDIKDLLKRHNVDFKSKDKKSILIRKYFSHVQEEHKKTEIQRLNNLTVVELKKILKDKDIEFNNKDKKFALIEKLLE